MLFSITEKKGLRRNNIGGGYIARGGGRGRVVCLF